MVLGRQLEPALLPRVDVYALGLIGYLLLVGRLPFHGTRPLDVVMQHAYQPPLTPSDVCADLPRSFDAPLLAALAKEPEMRTESVEALREALLDARNAEATGSSSLRVLVADDSPAFRGFLVDVLSAALPGALIRACPTGRRRSPRSG